MKKFLLALGFIFAGGLANAQTNNGIIFVTTAPSGSCATRANVRERTPNGTLYTCQNGTWGIVGGGGGGSPAGSGTELQARASASTFGAVTHSANVTAIADPSALAVAPTCSGTCATTYGYRLVVLNGIGQTLPSTETTVMNAASLDGSHFNTITLPTVAGARCFVQRSTGTPGSERAARICDGSMFADDGTLFSYPTLTLPMVNTTAGLYLGATFAGYPGIGVPASNNLVRGGLQNYIASQDNLNLIDWLGNVHGEAYLGFEYDVTAGHYFLETDFFRFDEASANNILCSSADNFAVGCPNLNYDFSLNILKVGESTTFPTSGTPNFAGLLVSSPGTNDYGGMSILAKSDGYAGVQYNWGFKAAMGDVSDAAGDPATAGQYVLYGYIAAELNDTTDAGSFDAYASFWGKQWMATNSTGNLAFGLTSLSGTSPRVVAGNMVITAAGPVLIKDLKTTGAATGKKIVCVDTATGQLYASSSGVACAN